MAASSLTLSLLGPEFKAKACKFFARGSCVNGSSCRFAHGPDEIRHPGSFFIRIPSNDYDPVSFLIEAFAPYAQHMGSSSVLPYVDTGFFRIATVNGRKENPADAILFVKNDFERIYGDFFCSSEMKAYYMGNQPFFVTALGFYLPSYIPYFSDKNVLEFSGVNQLSPSFPPVPS